MSEEIPLKVRKLIDKHGAGIPHYDSDGDYIIDVYPDVNPKSPDFAKKIVKVFNRKTREFWQEVIND